MKITAPGRYALGMSDYRRHDICAGTLSLSSSDAVILIDDTPAHLKVSWTAERKAERKADKGTVIHTLALEPLRKESAITVIDAPNYRKAATQEARDAAIAAGRTPILAADYDDACHALRALMEHPDSGPILRGGGDAEQSWFARHETGVYVKARPDLFTPDEIIVDIKSVASAQDEFIRRRIYDGHWYIQAPFHADVVARVLGHEPKDYLWLCVEQTPPHAIKVIRPTWDTMNAGSRKIAPAIGIFARCAGNGEWPAYPAGVRELGLPDWTHFRLEEQALAERDGD
jgi:hypothetical protein